MGHRRIHTETWCSHQDPAGGRAYLSGHTAPRVCGPRRRNAEGPPRKAEGPGTMGEVGHRPRRDAGGPMAYRISHTGEIGRDPEDPTARRRDGFLRARPANGAALRSDFGT